MTSPDDTTPTTPRDPRPADGERLGAPDRTSGEGTAPTPRTEPRTGTAPSSRRTPAEDPREVSDVPSSGRRTAGVWIALVLGAIVLILLLVFILQNNTSTVFHYFAGQFSLPLGVAMLLAAIAGALVMGLVGSVRMFQQGRTIKKLRRQQGRIQQMLDD